MPNEDNAPPGAACDGAFTENELEAGRLLFATPVTFSRGVASLAQLPGSGPVEAAFAGRSNVGKSSLLNALAGRRDLARTSNTPGRTREVNFFEAGDGRLTLVDLPGYGYAKAQKSLVRQWQALVRDYLRGRPTLRRVFLLVDSRHGLKPADAATLDLLDEAAVNYQIVLTKADKLKEAERAAVVAATRQAVSRRPAAHPAIHLTSSVKGDGIADLRAEIARLLE